jgi:hypothetical protein
VRAVLAMSPQGPGEEGFDEHSWDDVRIPVMTMSGTLDRGVGGQPATWRLAPFQHMAAGDKYQVTVKGAGHLAFVFGERYQSCIIAESVAFWDTYLKKSVPGAKISSIGECQVTAK